MPFCPNCGKMLADNEVCNCTGGATASPNSIPTPPPAPAPEFNNTQNVYNNINGAQPKKKMSVGKILLIIFIPIILIILIIGGILAAILIPSMSGYVKKSKISSQNVSASSVYKGASSALTELDAAGNNVSGYFIIASDKSKNVNVPNDKFDLNKFYDQMDSYYADNSKCEWFVVCYSGTATYAASAESWGDKVVGTYPMQATVDRGACLYNSYSYEKSALKDIYADAKTKIN